jgi:glutamate racemase
MNKEYTKEKVLLGIFDSGVGGFSVAREVRKVTDANIVYYGDCARAPYGNREESEIVDFIRDDITYLQDMDVTHFVNACNSMSVLTTDALLKECNIKPQHYIDMVRAFSVHATFKKEDAVLVIATKATIRSGAYQEELARKGVTVFEYTYKELAQAIERNATRDELLSIIEKSIVYAQEVGATQILYGCTHYPLIHELFLAAQEKVGWHGTFIDPAIYVAEEIKKWNLEGKRKFYPYSSKDTPAFINNIIKFL